MELNIGEIITKEYQGYDKETQELIYEYLSQFDELQKKAYFIAKQHLGSSFHLLKSNGYLEWKNKK